MNATVTNDQLLISADSHVMEDPDLWQQRLPASFKAQAPVFPARQTPTAAHSETTLNAPRPGGWDPKERIGEMELDGVTAEVLYPTLGLRLFGMEDARLQEACFRVYNDWLIEYCGEAPDRLVGIGLVAAYDIEHAVGELERCQREGLRGALVWQVPHETLPFTSDHYEPLWSAAEDLGMPISLHILTGFDYSKHLTELRGSDQHRGAVNLKLSGIMNTLFDLIFSGALERHPRLKLVVVESEIGWMPFALQQWDYYFKRFQQTTDLPIDKTPGEYFDRQIFATFFNDRVGGQLLSGWGVDNCMWSTDYPHPNSSWPHSRELMVEQLGHLDEATIDRLVRRNVIDLYGLSVGQTV